MMKGRVFLVVGLAGVVIVGWAGAGVQPGKAKIPNFHVPDYTKAETCKVVRAISGDTIAVRTAKGFVQVLLLGVDAPDTGRAGKAGQPYAEESHRFLENLVKGEEVYLLADPQVEKPEFGPRPAYVYRLPEVLLVNAEVVRQGYGRAAGGRAFGLAKQFAQLEQFARAASKGLWDAPRKPAAEPAPGKPAPGKPGMPPVIPDEPVRPDAKPTPKPGSTTPPFKPKVWRPGPGTSHVVGRVTPADKKYHHEGCPAIKGRNFPMKFTEAVRRGYNRCEICRPP